MATVDVGVQRQSLLLDSVLLEQLPPELIEIIRDHTPQSSFLDAIAEAALRPRLTRRIFAHFESVFADICSRWVSNSTTTTTQQNDDVIASFARILPFAPYLSVFLENYLRDTTARHAREPASPCFHSLDISDTTSVPQEAYLKRILLAVLRLVSFDRAIYSPLVLPSRIQVLFKHPSASVRYLAIRVFSQMVSASDYKLEALLKQYIHDGELLLADLDGDEADYTFLSLYEHSRAEELRDLRGEIVRKQRDLISPGVLLQTLSPCVISYGKTVLPRPSEPSNNTFHLAKTPTTLKNLESLARLLQSPCPIMLHGVSGAGKTSLVHEVARELGMDSGLITLHLNEQTDAKMLIGLYTTHSKPGSFQWRPGVLTTAVKEGRWVLVEDLDRAPNEVMSTLLPLIERRELLIPSRGERLQAHANFRILATVRTSVGFPGQENIPSLLGIRHWQLLPVQALPREELRDVILATYPLLHKFVPGILSVFDNVCTSVRKPSSLSRVLVERPPSPRDLMKWCRHLQHTLTAAGCRTGDEPISETTRDWMFLDAADCFAGNVKEPSVREVLVSTIGQEMHVPRERVNHYLAAHIPNLSEDDTQLRVGRVTLRKRKPPHRVAGSKRPFAATCHAKRLLEQISVAVEMREPVLLVGETGIGKTAVVQQLAQSLGHKLIAVNLSQQSEVGDLLGGFKPVNVRNLAIPLKEEFEDLFSLTGISAEKNQKYLDRINKSIARGKWTEISKLWRQAPKMFEEILKNLQKAQSRATAEGSTDGQPAKRRKTDSSKLRYLLGLKPRWDAFDKTLDQFNIQISGGSNSPFAFAFMEGNIVKAVRNGDWVLLDEINLASPDTLESIADLFQSGPNEAPSILLSETGEVEKVRAHPEFRVFAAMNPATDVGKRDLPQGLRSRFTEMYVSSPDRDLKDLLVIIRTYLKGSNSAIDHTVDAVARLYLEIKELAEQKSLVDGANEVPHYSLRTLTRVLSYANDVAPFYGLERALYEGFCMGFLTVLSRDSEKLVMPLIQKYLLKRRNLLSQPPKYPGDGRHYVRFTNRQRDQQYWVLSGDQDPIERPDYIITSYVERNLLNLVRATSTRRFPILIQGPTSSGKTSMIEYLANFSGNKFVRINNHEHTDLQEYLGTYVSGSDGKLKYQEGLLVQAMRRGYWIVLDELNLAPTDVLEALNRLLDDNRELLVPETQEVVRPHENFMLFATQNPPGLYGGRKILSRAFRNRFLELHFDDIPEDELETILQQRSRNTAPSDCKRIVTVYKELSRLRQTNRVFEQKQSFATLRDLFRWALRDAYNRDQIAAYGFMLLAERVRNEEERAAVREIIESVFKVKIDPDILYGASESRMLDLVLNAPSRHGVVWTKAMRRLYILVASAIRNNEPVLLVGETGCGKTTVCQILAEALGKELYIVNAHQNTETGDLIGSQRPVRNRGSILEGLKCDLVRVFEHLGRPSDGGVEELLQKFHALPQADLERLPGGTMESIVEQETRSMALFEWSDGSLVHAMKQGQMFLLDEISLADDSVLERLNSVLEPHRTLLLAEKGVDNSFVQAAESFQFLATMNPGGDFGKKELSPALRNRFTEIWVPSLSETDDVFYIVSSKLKEDLRPIASIIVEFSSWFGQSFRSSSTTAFSIRDILVWVDFVNRCDSRSVDFALVHGAATVFIDTLGANPSALISVDPRTMGTQRQKCLDKLGELIGHSITALYRDEPDIAIGQDLSIGPFSIPRQSSNDFYGMDAFQAPTTKLNAMRVIRALAVRRPILLEGNPGVGKTTLISNLARVCGKPLTRINLSDQTDLMDLFGSDVPVEGAEAGNFAWRDAPFLQAMQKGEWVLLDEMNLASQSVLEGLNACLDHRGEVYISELDQVFKRHPDFRLFAAQNPHHQGGGRKGLPSSFVNRFIVVFADVFTDQDLRLIAETRHKTIAPETIHRMIDFISSLDREVVLNKSFASQGSPWEFNLRDTLRWLELLDSNDPLLSSGEAADFLDIVIRQRFRTGRDRREVTDLFSKSFKLNARVRSLYHNTSSTFSQVGLGIVSRNLMFQPTQFPPLDTIPRLGEIESLMVAVKQNLPCILVGPAGSGKSVLLQHVAASCGKSVVVFPMNADVDAMDLIGGFEQTDPHREVQAGLDALRETLQSHIFSSLPNEISGLEVDLWAFLNQYQRGSSTLSDIQACVKIMSTDLSLPPALAVAVSESLALLERPSTSEIPRFEWQDGVIVDAIETGEWLVLDNANLCSSSVLDRLNSLLERPGSFLSINEHSGPDGEPRIIRPHAEFRVFLTMDPRYGELSRAMRNRSIEIYLDETTWEVRPHLGRILPIESALQRYHTATHTVKRTADSDGAAELVALTLDNLSLADTVLLPKYNDAGNSLWTDTEFRSSSIRERISQVISYARSPKILFRDAIIQAYASFAKQASAFLANPNESLSEVSRELLEQELVVSQPLHPLQNSTLASLLERHDGRRLACLTSCYEYHFEIQTAWQAMKSQMTGANLTKPSTLNRFQRSCVSDKIPTASKDSTANASTFLSASLDVVANFLQAGSSHHSSWAVSVTRLDKVTSLADAVQEFRPPLRAFMLFWTRTFRFLCSMEFEEAVFQAHLNQGYRLLALERTNSTDVQGAGLVSSLRIRLDENFVVGFKLSSGLSMEAIWTLFRPMPIPDATAFSLVVQMECLASRFDGLKWRAEAPVTDLKNAMSSLCRAYLAIRQGHQANGLVRDLEDELAALESGLHQSMEISSPYFEKEFDGLRQTIALFYSTRGQEISRSLTFGDTYTLVLSKLPTIAQMRLESSTPSAKALYVIDYIMSQDNDIRPWTNTLSQSILAKFDTLDSVSLSSLDRVEVEMKSLGRTLANMPEAITSDTIDELNRLLWELLIKVMGAHGPFMRENLLAIYQHVHQSVDSSHVSLTESGLSVQISELWSLPAPQCPPHLGQVVRDHFSTVVVALAAANRGIGPKTAFSAVAWVQFALGCLKLYVPDKIFDPYLRAHVEREFEEELRQLLKKKLSASRQFDRMFSGQGTGMRSSLLQDEITALGPLPGSGARIYRPSSAELSRLQGEFVNVLNSLIESDISLVHFQSLASGVELPAQLELIKANVERLIDRLSNGYRAYQDLTAPLVGFLRCLQVGLSLNGSVETRSANPPDCQALLAVTPYLGGKLSNFTATTLKPRSFESLSFIRSVVSVDGLTGLSVHLRQSLFESFHSFHQEWTVKLEEDRRAEQLKQSLYHYRGGLAQEEEVDQTEFDELFPGYADDEDENPGSQPQKSHSNALHELSVKVAEWHHKIFLTPQDAQQALGELCKIVGRRLSRDHKRAWGGNHGMDKAMLPAVMLVFDEKMTGITSGVTPLAYNFYTDPNLPEARKLATLVQSIRARFKALQAVDEIGHMQPLADVVAACDRLLELGHNEPLAKLITRTEQVHSCVYEWQFGGWASRIYGASSFYEKLTETIVSWRRLELSTWSKLFDMEETKCRQDAYSWWFIAYQVSIVEPLKRVTSGQDVAQYAVELVDSLQSYASDALVGQYVVRLSLLRQLLRHLDLLTVDFPDVAVIRNAVQNFVAIFECYEQRVREAVQKGRAPIEKAMKDVLLLASWKDTNIAALRESAKKSHQKLFRLVRKFRAVLGQPVKSIIDQGLPDDESKASSATRRVGHSASSIVNSEALRQCEDSPGWLQDPRSARLSDARNVIAIMSRLGRLSERAIIPAELLDSFVSDLSLSILGLRKETPAFLTEENKDQVKHLKSRKVKLFNETVKTIRHMGFSRNLSEAALTKQNSLSVTLVGSDALGSSTLLDLGDVEHCYSRVLDLAPRIRSAARTHSDNLSLDAVNRSLGYLEGILSVTIQQRQGLSVLTKELGSLSLTVDQLKHIGAPGDEAGDIVMEKRVTNTAQVLRWLNEILKIALRLIDMNSTHGGADNSGVRGQIDIWLQRFTLLSTKHEKLVRLPIGFTSTDRVELEGQVILELERLCGSLETLNQQRPDLAHILEQVQLWTSVMTLETVADGPETPLMELREQVLTTSNLVLDAVQKFEKETTTLPTSTDDTAWLISYSNGLLRAIKSLNMRTVESALLACMRMTRTTSLDDRSTRELALALLAALLPLAQQYQSICTDGVCQFAKLHQSTCNMACALGKAFIQVAEKGFCTPQEKSDQTSGESGNIEAGTGLGDGEGAEDISKDIQPDEDLSELAKETGKEEKSEIEDQEDAVDMGLDELEGDLGSVDGASDDEDRSKSGDEQEEPDDMDEEAGEVDDLDPTAVDEKVWDGDGQEAEKDQQGDRPRGQKQDDDNVAATDGKDNDVNAEEKQEEVEAAAEDPDEELGQDQEEEAVAQDELNKQDQTVQENEALDLPDDINLDANESSSAGSEDEEELDALSDMEPPVEEGDSRAPEQAGNEETEIVEDQDHEDTDVGSEEDGEEDLAMGHDEDRMEMDPEEQERGEEEEDEEKPLAPAPDHTKTDQGNAVPSDVQSGGQENIDADGNDDEKVQSSASRREHGDTGESGADQEATGGQNGDLSQPQPHQGQDPSQQPQPLELRSNEPFKKLGDAWERWYQNQREIQDQADKDPNDGQRERPSDAELSRMEFQHLQDENAEADTQALGTATEEEARPMDDSMAVDTQMDEGQNHILLDDTDQDDETIQPGEIDDSDPDAPQNVPQSDRDDGRPGAATRQGAYDQEHSESPVGNPATEQDDEEIEETSTQLSTTYLNENDKPPRDFSECLRMWTSFQSKTHSLSLSLTSQLRLILTPSQATKLSGSHRTGKRLNIKKIIPYIASGYKRDKIWMRRSVPTKRAYQILLCVDDSRSMGETASGTLALESLVMVSRALAMLEAGQVGVLGFGARVFAAHDLLATEGPSFASASAGPDAGARALQRFTFAQDRTDVALLVRVIINRFRAARLQSTGSGSGAADLWQLALILSDGLTPRAAHDAIRRLLREAAEERIMVVFIIMDGVKSGGDSVLELKEARFITDAEDGDGESGGARSRVVIERYLDTFPFPYYLIVHRLEDLPGALAGLLRTWFAEVNS